MEGKRGLPGAEIVCLLIALGLLSVAAIPRYIDNRREKQRVEREEAARKYIRALNQTLTVHMSRRGSEGLEWVRDGQALMDLLDGKLRMPAGMRYHRNVWAEEGTELKWRFHQGSGRIPPRIRRLNQRPLPEPGEIEPIRRPPR